MHPLLLIFIIDASIQIVCWIISASLKTEKIFDLSGAVTYLTCFLTSLLYRPIYIVSLDSLSFRAYLVVVLACVWCIRLGVFLFLRVLRTHDKRFDQLKQNPLTYLTVWVGQIVWVFCTGLAVYLCASAPTLDQPQFNALDVIGTLIWVIGFGFEVIADYQKNVFKNAHPAEFMQTGLFQYCRYPNYFGEVTLWFGMFLVCINGFTASWGWVGVISPVFVFVLLYFGSGVKMSEQAANNRYGQLEEYKSYKARTNLFLPWIPTTNTHSVATSDS